MTPEAIKELRQALKLTQGQLASLLGVHSLTVWKWEKGRLKPDPFQVALLQVFEKALAHTPDIGLGIPALLAAEGVPATLYILLHEAFNN